MAAMPMGFGSTLTLPTFVYFFSLLFFQVLVLYLGVVLGLGFIFYVCFVSIKPTALLSCVIVTSQLAFE